MSRQRRHFWQPFQRAAIVLRGFSIAVVAECQQSCRSLSPATVVYSYATSAIAAWVLYGVPDLCLWTRDCTIEV